MQKKSRAAFLGLPLIALLAGCGSSGSGVTQADIDRFVGNWTFDNEVIKANCVGGQNFQQDLTGKIMTLTQGTGAQIMLTLADTCQVSFTISGTTATAAPPNQICKLTIGGSGEQEIVATSWTLTTSDGLTMSTKQTGTALAGLCTVGGSGMLTKQTGGATDAGAGG